MQQHFVFVHGWGIGLDFWDKVKAGFSEHNISYIDLGFVRGYGEYKNIIKKPPSSVICIGHSLGAQWLLKYHADLMGAFIAINGFANFNNFVPCRQVLAMKKRLERSPAAQMNDFWQRTGLQVSYDQNRIDIDKLQEGLDQLLSCNVQEELSSLSCPILSLAGTDDQLLLPEEMKKQWSSFDLRFCSGAKHALAQSHPQWCIEQIKEFLHDIELER